MSAVGKELVHRLKRLAEELERTDDIAERFTCRTVRLNLQPQAYNAELVKKTRATLRASQAIFAKFLGVAPNTVRDWEQGVKHPSGAACRIMDEIRQNPQYWLQRLKQLCTPITS